MNTNNENQTTSRKALLMDSFKIIRKASNARGNLFSRFVNRRFPDRWATCKSYEIFQLTPSLGDCMP